MNTKILLAGAAVAAVGVGSALIFRSGTPTDVLSVMRSHEPEDPVHKLPKDLLAEIDRFDRLEHAEGADEGSPELDAYPLNTDPDAYVEMDPTAPGFDVHAVVQSGALDLGVGSMFLDGEHYRIAKEALIRAGYDPQDYAEFEEDED